MSLTRAPSSTEIPSPAPDTIETEERTLVPRIITPPPGPKALAELKRQEKYVFPSLTQIYPFFASHGRGSFVWDVDGNCYIDFATGIAVNNLGHAHPAISAAIHNQVDKLLHFSAADFYNVPYGRLCERLAKLAPGESPKKVFLSNSGAEAVECAIKLARHATGRDKFIGFKGAFHGRTWATLSFTSSKAIQRKGFGRQLLDVHRLPYPDPYRGRTLEILEEDLKRDFERELPTEEVAAVLIEPIQGEGGYLVPPAEFMRRLRDICTKYGILLIADEVQTGAGRTGKMFCMEHYGVEPDITTMAKGIANGLPLGATIAKAEIADSFEHASHASTFGGNPVACQAALEVFDQLEQGVLENCARMGIYLKERLVELQKRHPLIGDVRGKGLMVGIDLVESGTKNYAPQKRHQCVQECFKRGLLLIDCGPSAIRLVPPLTITQREIDLGLDILDQTLTGIERQG